MPRYDYTAGVGIDRDGDAIIRQRAVVGVVAVLIVAVLLTSIASAHEPNEVAGPVVVFEAGPEPAITGELKSLRWRCQGKDSEEPFGDLEETSAAEDN